MKRSAEAGVDLNQLIGEFYDGDQSLSPLGSFVAADKMPANYERLLRHEHHMTVTVEEFHGSPVDVRVHRYHTREPWYVREITLVKTGTDEVVQYGIVRFDRSSVTESVWRQIESRQIPLGRVLINHDVHRVVHLCRTWEITTGPVAAAMLDVPAESKVYGRTALIDCNDLPAIELLEVVVA